MYAAEDGVLLRGDAYEAVLVFERAAVASLGGLRAFERDAGHAEAEADELVAAADAEDGRRRLHGAGPDAAQHLRGVVVEVGERAAQPDGLGLELLGGVHGLGQMRDANLGLFDEPLDVVDDVV